MSDPQPVPADVYRAARRLYLDTCENHVLDADTIDQWGAKRWPGIRPDKIDTLAFWILSIAARDGHE